MTNRPNMEQVRNGQVIAEEHGGRLVYLRYPEGEKDGKQIYLSVCQVIKTPEEVEATCFEFCDLNGRIIASVMVMDDDLEWLLANRMDQE